MSDNGMYRFKKLLDERGVNYDGNERKVRFSGKDGCECRAYTRPNNLYIDVTLIDVTPEQAIAATLGPGTCHEVYLVETSDELIESWYPIGVYLHREAAEDCAEAFRKGEDDVRQFARVSELKVVDG